MRRKKNWSLNKWKVGFLQREIYQSRARGWAETIAFKLNGAARSKREELVL
jgi:hypothetical protein